MVRYLVFIFVFLFVYHNLVSQITCAPEDSTLFRQKLIQLQQIETQNLGDSIVVIGKSFLDTPYVEKTLEIGDTETLVMNLRGLDCTTFVENVLAFGLQLKRGDTRFIDFAKNLETIRYRNSTVNGYSSRLHYFTDWIRTNQAKGLVLEVTSDLGGEMVQKSIDFMGSHRNLYPFLADDTNYTEILKVEAELKEEDLCVLPQNRIKEQEKNIKNGDIIALSTSINGLDVTHTGFAIRVDGRIHLLHASTSGSVTITKVPLVDYLKNIKHNTGIIIARPTL